MLDTAGALDAFETRLIKLVQDCPNLTDLHLETVVLGQLSCIRFVLNIVKDRNLFSKIPLNVGALGLGDIFNGVLFAFQLANLFALELYLLSKLFNVLFELVDGCFETEGL